MKDVLQQINQVQGVIGSLVCTTGGEVLANAFPPIFDAQTLQEAAGLAAGSLAESGEYTGGADLIDLHCAEGRILIKAMPKGFLLLLCAGTFNMQMLNISLNVAVGKLNASLAAASPASGTAPASPAKPAGGPLRRDGKGFILTVDSLTVSAKLPWDQMQEGVAFGNELAAEICIAANVDAIKKVKLTNRTAKASKSFGTVRFFERDGAPATDDRIVMTLAAAEAVKAKPGDELFVEINAGGLFG